MEKSSDIMSHWQMFESTIFLEWGGGVGGKCLKVQLFWGFFLGGGGFTFTVFD